MRQSLLCALTAVAACATASAPAAAQTKPPRLVVVIVVDQLGSNLFNQYRPAFSGGLKTLSGGIVYANGYQSHAITTTCPGHATVLTGMRPNRTGIASNQWYDRSTGKNAYCLAAPQNTLADGGPGENGRVGPDLLTATTLGDWLDAKDPKSRIYAVSGKDRGAINLAGHKSDGTFWYTEGFGFTTYVEPGQKAADRVAPLAGFNARLKARFAATPASWSYTRDECRKLEADWQIGGETWRSAVPPQNFELDTSPLLDELTLEAATTLLDEQKLGQGASTDILGVSLSATDRIGHAFGTQGPEMCEQLHRLDAALATFLARLANLPQGVAVVLTADHGGSDFPERSHAHGFEEASRSGSAYVAKANVELRSKFALAYDPLVSGSSGLMVVGADRRGLAEPLRTQIANAAVEILRREPVVAAVHTFEEAAATPPAPRGTSPEEYTILERLHFSAVRDRSPDIFVVLKPGVSDTSGKIGGTLSGHGSPWDYDRRVPIVFWRPAIAPQERFLPVETADIAPSIANLIGLAAPADLDGRCLSLVELGGPACR